jgi:hypothetical protein
MEPGVMVDDDGGGSESIELTESMESGEDDEMGKFTTESPPYTPDDGHGTGSVNPGEKLCGTERSVEKPDSPGGDGYIV